MKICSQCKVEKHESDFSKEKRVKNGLQAKCKKCICYNSVEYRKTDEYKKYHKQYRKTEKYKEKVKKNSKENPETHYKNLIRRDLREQVKRGRIIKLPCQVCGDIKSEAHHSNYNRPLSVVWLCRKHHLELHKGNLSI